MSVDNDSDYGDESMHEKPGAQTGLEEEDV